MGYPRPNVGKPPAQPIAASIVTYDNMEKKQLFRVGVAAKGVLGDAHTEERPNQVANRTDRTEQRQRHSKK
eukprot:9064488-Alexandrium_andersonii.AAC.1